MIAAGPLLREDDIMRAWQTLSGNFSVRPLRWRSFLLCAALALDTTPLLAQRGELQGGVRVRLRAPGILSGEVEGGIVARHGDTIVFAPQGKAPVRLSVASVTAAAIHRGRDRASGFRKGALRGAGIGLGLGVFSIVFSDCAGKYCDTSHKVGGALVFGALGAAIGGVVGGTRSGDRWERLVFD